MNNKLPDIVSQTLEGNVPMNTTKTAQFTPVCTCQAVREYYDTGIGEMFEDKVRLCPFHTAAPAMYEALVETMRVLRSLRDNKEEWYTLVTPELLTAWDKNKAALTQAEGKAL